MISLQVIQQGSMMELSNNSYNYQDLIAEFGQQKLEKRYQVIYDYMKSFIERKGYVDRVTISQSLLNQMIVDYFTDIHRLKDFHAIAYVNYIKIHAYSAYWLLRRKPIQIIQDDSDNLELTFINEAFIVSYIMNFLHENDKDVYILEEDRENYLEFVKNLEYSLKYRAITAQMLETMMEAFIAGRSVEKAKR